MRAPDGGVLLEPGRRQRGRGGQVLRLDAATRCARWSRADEWAVRHADFGLDRPPNFEGHAWNLRVIAAAGPRRRAPRHLAARTRRRASPARERRCSPRARSAFGPGRDDKILDVVERARDRGPGARRARARRAALGGDGVRGGRFAPAHRLARRTSARHAVGEHADLNALSRRSRVPAGGTARTDADAIPARGLGWAIELADGLLERFEDRAARRLLLHQSGPRGTVPSRKARARQCNAFGQRRCRVGAGRVRALASATRDTSMPPNARSALFAPELDGVAGGLRRCWSRSTAVCAAHDGSASGDSATCAHGSDRSRPVPPGSTCSTWRQPTFRRRWQSRRRRAGAAAWVCARHPPRACHGSIRWRARRRALGQATQALPASAIRHGARHRGSVDERPRYATILQEAMKASSRSRRAALFATGAVPRRARQHHGRRDDEKGRLRGLPYDRQEDRRPAYVEVAAKYKGDKDAVAKLTKKVKEGGAGVWGQIPMPPNAAVPKPTSRNSSPGFSR